MQRAPEKEEEEATIRGGNEREKPRKNELIMGRCLGNGTLAKWEGVLFVILFLFELQKQDPLSRLCV